ncbi:MAG: M23 family metallopeptidase [Pseudomonadota bacterium]
MRTALAASCVAIVVFVGAAVAQTSSNDAIAELIAATEISEISKASAPATLSCPDEAPAGGLIICTGPPNTDIYDASSGGGLKARTDTAGLALIGAPRLASTSITLSFSGAASGDTAIALTPRDDPYREITGLDCDKVDARTPTQKDHAGRSWVKKQKAFKTFYAPLTDEVKFISPAKGPFSSPFGPTRKYIGISKVTGKPCESMSVHRGLDVAVPVGTELVAPMAGVVTLADLDLYYEGGAIFLDHGRGLKSVFIHLSEIDVAPGQHVAQGERIGATGNTGRTTGPHLHWAVKWRNETSEDRSGDFYIDPKLLLEMSEK